MVVNVLTRGRKEVIKVKVIKGATEEKVVLAATDKDASVADVYRSVVQRAECCVDHLCGCKK